MSNYFCLGGYIVLDSRIVPRRETNTDEVNTVFDQADSTLIDMLYENNESSNNCRRETGSTHSVSSSDGQIAPTMQVDRCDISLIETPPYQSCCQRLEQARLDCMTSFQQEINASKRMLTRRAQRELEGYFVQYERLIHRFNRLHKTIHRRMKYHCSKV